MSTENLPEEQHPPSNVNESVIPSQPMKVNSHNNDQATVQYSEPSSSSNRSTNRSSIPFDENNAEGNFKRRDYNPSIVIDKKYAEKHPEQIAYLSKHQLIYSVLGLILGFVSIIGGIILFLNGVIGSTDWTANILGSDSSISDAAPGSVLFIIGLFIVITTRYVLKIK